MDTSYKKIEEKEYTSEEKREIWEVSIGLNKVDNLEQSQFFYGLMKEEINGKITCQEMRESLQNHYKKEKEKKIDDNIKLLPNEEADLVGVRMTELLKQNEFNFSIRYLMGIHKYIFQDIFTQLEEKYLGKIRDYNVTKEEKVLNGDSVKYGIFFMINDILEYCFAEEKNKTYYKQSEKIIVKQVSKFTSDIWQAHPFIEGNTRTIALFIEKYLTYIGIPIMRDVFKDNSLYFRNALVLANAPENKQITSEYLEDFFEKGLFEKEKILLNIYPIKTNSI